MRSTYAVHPILLDFFFFIIITLSEKLAIAGLFRSHSAMSLFNGLP
jgi:hypothetical protein